MRCRAGRFPAAAQRQEQRDLVGRELRIAGGQCAFGRGQRALRVQRGQKVGAAVAVQRAGLLRRQRALVARRLQRGIAVELARIDRQRGLGFAQRVEHRAVEAGQRRLAGGPRFGNAAARRAIGRDRPRDQRAYAPAPGIGGAEVGQFADAAARQPQRDARIQVGGGDADAGGGAGQAAFGLPDIGPAPQQRRAVADRHRVGQARRGAALGGGRQCGRRLAGERGQPELRAALQRRQRRQHGPQLFDLRRGAAGVERAAAAGADAPFGQREEFPLQVQRAPGDPDLRRG
jgi:hypothetical protein